MKTIDCVWNDLFDNSEQQNLEGGLFLTGLISTIFGVWLSVSILLTNLSHDRSYKNLANFTTAACLRKIVALIAHSPLLRSNELDPMSCNLFAFLETFLAVFEVEWLTHVCIERYVVAKYTKNGWPIENYHYTLFQCLCFFFATLYSVPPLIGFGQYAFDFSCSFYTFDMVLPESWKRYIVVIIFVLRSVKPAMFMVMMLTWSRIIERKLICSEETLKQFKFTKNVIVITVVSQLCWSPIALIRGSVVISQLFYSHPFVPASAFYIKCSMWIHWMASGFTALVLFVADSQIRNKMLHLLSTKDAVKLHDEDNKKDM